VFGGIQWYPPNSSELVTPAMAHLNLELDDNFSLVISDDPTLISLYKSSYQHLELQLVVRLDLCRGQDGES
jgi:hypothetical protein